MIVRKNWQYSDACYYRWCFVDTSNTACSATSFTTTTNYSPFDVSTYISLDVYNLYFLTIYYASGTSVPV